MKKHKSFLAQFLLLFLLLCESSFSNDSTTPEGHVTCPCQIFPPVIDEWPQVVDIIYGFFNEQNNRWPITVVFKPPTVHEGTWFRAGSGLECCDPLARANPVEHFLQPPGQTSDFEELRPGTNHTFESPTYVLKYKNHCAFGPLVDGSLVYGRAKIRVMGPPKPPKPIDEEEEGDPIVILIDEPEDPPEDCDGSGPTPFETETCEPYSNEDDRESNDLEPATFPEIVSENLRFSHWKKGFGPYTGEDDPSDEEPKMRYLLETVVSSLEVPPSDSEDLQGPESPVGGTAIWRVCRMTGQVILESATRATAVRGGASNATSPTTATDTFGVSSYDDPPNCEGDAPGTMTVDSTLSEEYTTALLKSDVCSHIWDFRGEGFYKQQAPFGVLDLSDDELYFDYGKTTYKWRLPADDVKYCRPYKVQWAEIFAPEGSQEIEFNQMEFDIVGDESPEFVIDLKARDEEGISYVLPVALSSSGQLYEVVEVNTGDCDSDHVPDFADGFSDKFENYGADPDSGGFVSEDPAGFSESAEFYELYEVGQWDADAYSEITFDSFGDESDPRSMTWQGEVDGELWPVSLPDGAIRIWAKEAKYDRSVQSIQDGGDFVPSGTPIPVDLLVGKKLYVEIVRPSETIGDYKVAIFGRPEDTDASDEVLRYQAFSAISTTYQIANADGSIEQIDGPAASMPTPSVTMGAVNVRRVYPSADGDQLLADVTISGSVRSGVCDITPAGDWGDAIESVSVSMNSEPNSLQVVGLAVSKGEADNLYRPYPFEGTFSQNVDGLPVVEGNNVLRVMAHDPVYRIPGEAAASFTVTATPQPLGGGGGGVLVTSVEFDFSDNPLGDQSSFLLSFSQGGNSLIEEELFEVNEFGDYLSTTSNKIFKPQGLAQFDPTLSDYVTGILTVGSVEYSFQQIAEESISSRTFSKVVTVPIGGNSLSYVGWSASAADLTMVDYSPTENVYSPMVIKLDGPDKLLEQVSNVEFSGQTVPVVERAGDFFLARTDNPDKVATVMLAPMTIVELDELPSLPYPVYPEYVESGDPNAVTPGENDGLAQNQLDAVKAATEREPLEDLANRLSYEASQVFFTNLTDRVRFQYYRGLGAGFVGNPKDSGKELWGLGKAAVKLFSTVTMFAPHRIAWEFTFGDRYQGEMKAIRDGFAKARGFGNKFAAYWPEIEKFFKVAGNWTASQVAEFLATGDLPGNITLSSTMTFAVRSLMQLMVMSAEWWNGLSPYKRGYYQGYILFEVVAAVVAGVITIEAGGVGAAALLARHLPKLNKVFKLIRTSLSKLGSEVRVLLDNIKALITKIDNALFKKWCFVAGTMISTANGMVPIEEIQVGDWVVSAHEVTGEVSMRPVLDLYQNEVDEIWTISYSQAFNENEEPSRLKCSSGHPFWVEEEQAFLPACELETGMTLRLLGDKRARIGSVHSQRGPPQGVKVYNFAVADHHTYFAGEGGVWVHNLCKAALDRYAAQQHSVYDQLLKNGMGDHEAWSKATEMTMRAARNEAKGVPDIDETALVDVARYLFDQPGKKVPRRPATGAATNLPAKQAEELAAFREALGRPTLADDVVKGEKTTHVKLEAPGGHSFGSSRGGSKKEFREFLEELANEGGINRPHGVPMNHAEAHAIYEAWNRGILSKADSVLYVDRPTCFQCNMTSGLKRILKLLDIDGVKIVDPDNPAGRWLAAEL